MKTVIAIAVATAIGFVIIAEDARAFDYNATPEQNWSTYQSTDYGSPDFNRGRQQYQAPRTTTYTPRSDGGYTGLDNRGGGVNISPLQGGGYIINEW